MTTSFAIAAAVNNDQVLARCLLASPDLNSYVRFSAFRGFSSASLAYNRALEGNSADVLILAHQDVYLPAGFISRLAREISRIEAIDPNWAVAGVIGIDSEQRVGGQVWSSGIGRVVGNSINHPMQVDSLDEMILIVRAASGVRFDEHLPGYHLYGLDIVQTAKASGMSSWAINIAAIHHSKPLLTLDRSFRTAWRYEQRKWRNELPLRSLVCDLELSPIRLWRKGLRMRWRSRHLTVRSDPTNNPSEIAQALGWET